MGGGAGMGGEEAYMARIWGGTKLEEGIIGLLSRADSFVYMFVCDPLLGRWLGSTLLVTTSVLLAGGTPFSTLETLSSGPSTLIPRRFTGFRLVEGIIPSCGGEDCLNLILPFGDVSNWFLSLCSVEMVLLLLLDDSVLFIAGAGTRSFVLVAVDEFVVICLEEVYGRLWSNYENKERIKKNICIYIYIQYVAHLLIRVLFAFRSSWRWDKRRLRWS